MAADRDPANEESPLLHQFKNHLAVVVGFCDVLLQEIAVADPKHADVLEMRKAAEAAMALLPQLHERVQ